MRLYLYGGRLLGDVMPDVSKIVREAADGCWEVSSQPIETLAEDDYLRCYRHEIATAILRVLDELPTRVTKTGILNPVAGRWYRYVHENAIAAVRAELEELK